MSVVASAFIPFLPPSENQIYRHKGPITYLTSKAKAFKRDGAAELHKVLPVTLQLSENLPYSLYMTFFFEPLQLLNKTWPVGAKSKFKTLDVSNRVKLTEDTVKAALGVDDRVFFDVASRKRISDTPGVLIMVEEATDVGLLSSIDRWFQQNGASPPVLEDAKTPAAGRPGEGGGRGDSIDW